VANSGIRNGLVHVFAHTQRILILTENDPALLVDIKIFSRIAQNARSTNIVQCSCSFAFDLLPPDKTLPWLMNISNLALGIIVFVEQCLSRRRTVIIQVLENDNPSDFMLAGLAFCQELTKEFS